MGICASLALGARDIGMYVYKIPFPRAGSALDFIVVFGKLGWGNSKLEKPRGMCAHLWSLPSHPICAVLVITIKIGEQKCVYLPMWVRKPWTSSCSQRTCSHIYTHIYNVSTDITFSKTAVQVDQAAIPHISAHRSPRSWST